MKKIFLSFVDYSLFLASITVGFVTAAYPAYLIALLRGQNGRAAFQKVTKYVFRIMFYLSPSISKITVIGKENLTACKNFVITPTHRSFLDYLLIESLIHDIVLFTNKPLTRLFIYRHVSNLLGAHIAADNSPASYFNLFDDFKRFLREGASVLIFPEGSRNSTDKLLAFKEGAFKLSIASNIPVLPIVILGSDKVYKKGSMIRVDAQPHEITIAILKPMSARENESSKEFCERVRGVLQAAYDDFGLELKSL